MEQKQERPPVVPCKYDGARCIYEGMRAGEPCWGDVLAPNDELEHTCEGHWGDGRYEAFDAAKHRPPRIDHEALRCAERERRERDMPTAKIGDPFEPREILASTGLGETLSTPTPLDIRITLDPGPDGQAIAREIQAVLDRAQSPAPDGSLAADIDAFEAAELADAHEHYGSAEELARWQGEARARANRLRAALGIVAQPSSPAPAWTREAPKEGGYYWIRVNAWAPPEIGQYMHGLGWDSGLACRQKVDAYEHWPVPIQEPPK